MADDDTADSATAEDLRPVHFESGSARLFGCLHMPVVARPRNAAVVICNPLGAEYERAHRALRQLAGRLSGAGFATLRFDYAGTGDSSGDGDDMSPRSWESDIHAARDFVREQAGTTTTILVGMRLGALLAARHAVRRGDCAALVLWRPILSGGAMIEEWGRRQRVELLARGRSDSDDPEDDSLLGWRTPRTWRAELGELAMPSWPSIACPTLALNGDDAAAPPGGAIDARKDPSAAIWQQDPMNPLVPSASLQVIAEWCGGRDVR
ncbi:MAG: hypothetical protein FJX57_08915 [Alphaproteobacteria bacterium]|nr:hypothetical protein [Alphaproteobacteria bacterium]